MYGDLLDSFHGLKVIEFNAADDWKGPKYAYRLREEYDDELKITDRLDDLLKQPGATQLTALIIGAWTEASGGDDSAPLVKKLSEVASQLPGLRALFMGEMTYEESEVSWINQSDLSPLLMAFPRLETLRIRGGNGLSFSPVEQSSLKEIAIETGGLPRSAIRELFLCQFPGLEHVELLLGEEQYGFDGSVEDLQPILSGKLYPNLKYLGLMNSAIANDIAAVVVNSPIVSRIETLDLSMGNLDSEGAQSLLGLAAYPQLKRLDISHHYASEESVAELTTALKCEVIAADRQEPEDEWRPIVHAE